MKAALDASPSVYARALTGSVQPRRFYNVQETRRYICVQDSQPLWFVVKHAQTTTARNAWMEQSMFLSVSFVLRNGNITSLSKGEHTLKKRWAYCLIQSIGQIIGSGG